MALPGRPVNVNLHASLDGQTWNSYAMTREEGTQNWRIDLDLPPGEWLYLVDVDGRTSLDPTNPLSTNSESDEPDGGVKEYSLIRVEDCTKPALFIDQNEVFIANGEPARRFGLIFTRSKNDSPIDPESLTAKVYGQNIYGIPQKIWAEDDYVWVEVTGLNRGKYQMIIEAKDKEGEAIISVGPDGSIRRDLKAPFWIEDELFRWEDALIYQLVTDRFARSDRDFTATEAHSNEWVLFDESTPINGHLPDANAKAVTQNGETDPPSGAADTKNGYKGAKNGDPDAQKGESSAKNGESSAQKGEFVSKSGEEASDICAQYIIDRHMSTAREDSFTIGSQTCVRKIWVRHGGDIKGITRHLREGYFDRLGVNALWISALNKNPDGLWHGILSSGRFSDSYHNYWPTDPRQPDERFGTEEDIREFVREAHARGIRVLMDIVLNHVHEQHPYCGHVAGQTPFCPAHPEWFVPEMLICNNGHWGDHILDCWFNDYMPDIAWNRIDILKTQIDDALYWVEHFDFDGLRVDAVPMMPRFVTRWLTSKLHERFEGLDTRHYLVGEYFTDQSNRNGVRWYLGPYGLDGLFDFPLMFNLRDILAKNLEPMWNLYEYYMDSEEAYSGSTAVMANFVSNHDVPRFVSLAEAGREFGGYPDRPATREAYDRLVLAYVFAYTIPGAATLYYGDELGMPGNNDPDDRRDMYFESEWTPFEQETYNQIAVLGRMRQCLPALRRGAFKIVRAEAERVIYMRDAGDGAPAIIALSRNPKWDQTEDGRNQRIPLPMPDDFESPSKTFIDVFSKQKLSRTLEGLESLELPSFKAALLIPADHPCAAELQAN